MKLRVVTIVEAAAVAALLVTQVGIPLDRDAAARRRVREIVALPGTGLQAMTSDQAGWLSGRLERLMRDRTQGRAGRDEFLNSMARLKQSGAVDSRPLCRDGRTLSDVACELGSLMHRELLETRVARDRVRDCLVRIRRVRAAGAPEAEVQRLAREAVARGELAPDQAVVNQDVRGRMELLVEDMVESVGAAESRGL